MTDENFPLVAGRFGTADFAVSWPVNDTVRKETFALHVHQYGRTDNLGIRASF